MATKGQKKGRGEKLAALAIDSFIGTLKTVTLAGTAENSAAVMGEPALLVRDYAGVVTQRALNCPSRWFLRSFVSVTHTPQALQP
jgi:hypothetical protein